MGSPSVLQPPKYRQVYEVLLRQIMSERILLLDGSMGALIYSHKLEDPDYRGERFKSHPVPLKNCTEALVLTQPKVIEEIHRAYLEAGADIVETCTFNGTRIALGFAGNSTFRSPPGSYVAEWWFFSTALSAADRDELYADEKAFFGLP